MASQEQVKRYLAYWFQLGKKVLLHNGQEALLPQPVMEAGSYSRAFENCWQKILACQGNNCYLEGTHQTIQQLFSPSWEIIPCSRCDMPVPTIDLGVQSPLCPCHDLPEWPNLELPQPREPVDSQARLKFIHQRLNKPQS